MAAGDIHLTFTLQDGDLPIAVTGAGVNGPVRMEMPGSVELRVLPPIRLDLDQVDI